MKRSIIFLVFTLIFLSGCRMAFLSNNANFTVTISGAVPKTTENKTISDGSKLLLNVSATIRLYAIVDGATIESVTPYTGATTSATLSNLPIDKEIIVNAETLDSNGNILTSWSNPVTLHSGTNTIEAKLKPKQESIKTTGADKLALADFTLKQGSAIFQTINFTAGETPEARNEFQIIANSRSFRSFWISVYDSNWDAVPSVCSDLDNGWTVINVPQGGGTYYVAIAAPDGERSGDLQARRTRFFSTGALGGDAGNTGTSISPKIDFFSSPESGFSYFIRETITNGFEGSLDWPTDLHVYGGFSAGDWKIRNPELYPTKFTALASDFGINAGSNTQGILDGMEVHARDYVASNGYGHMAIDLATTYPFVVNNCKIFGPSTGGLYIQIAAMATGIKVEAGTPQIVNTYVDAGTGATGLGAVGIHIIDGRPFIYKCKIYGGFSNAVAANEDMKGYGIALNLVGTGTGSAIITASSIYGATLSHNGQGATTSSAIYSNASISTADPVIIVNSLISGGYAETSNLGLNLASHSYGIYTSNTTNKTLVAANNIIHSGKSFSAVLNTNIEGKFGVYSTVGNITLSGNVFLMDNSTVFSALYDKAIFVYELTTTGITLDGNSAFGSTPAPTYVYLKSASNYENLINYASTNYKNNVTDLALNPATLFTKYDYSQITASSSDFSNWLLSFNPTPRTSMQSILAGANNPVTASYISATDVGNYPELLLDLNGRQRPAGNWARGACEP